jgi:hypothetical protein
MAGEGASLGAHAELAVHLAEEPLVPAFRRGGS